MVVKALKLNYRDNIYPITDMHELDKQGKAMEMPPMKEYNSTWNRNEYKKLPKIEKIVK